MLSDQEPVRARRFSLFLVSITERSIKHNASWFTCPGLHLLWSPSPLVSWFWRPALGVMPWCYALVLCPGVMPWRADFACCEINHYILSEKAMNRFLHILGSTLLLAAYLLSFAELPELHSHIAFEPAPACHVHLQSADRSADNLGLQNCHFCLRIHASSFTLAVTNPVRIVLTPEECLYDPSSLQQSSAILEHCHGRAPPAQRS